MTARHIVAISGGKDSCAMALRLKEKNPDVDYEYVITPTGDELPEMQTHWASMEKRLGKPFKKLGTMTLKECIKQEGMIPNFRARFCTRILKIEPFIDYMNTLDTGSIMYVGLRADEEGQLGLLQPDSIFTVAYPMREWNWGLAHVMGYLERQGVTIPARTDCGVCFYQKLSEWKVLLEKHPERYQSYVDIETEMGHTFRSPGRDTWPAALSELRVEFRSGRKLRAARKSPEKKCRFCSM
ncbi:MAG: phosphoadenosine phosphosulfate reductase family protein [Thiohalomonadales bacterium]